MPLRLPYKMADMIDSKDDGRKFAFLLLGITVPVLGYIIWSRVFGRSRERRDEIDQAHDITVEDSFPASDPPSAW